MKTNKSSDKNKNRDSNRNSTNLNARKQSVNKHSQ